MPLVSEGPQGGRHINFSRAEQGARCLVNIMDFVSFCSKVNVGASWRKEKSLQTAFHCFFVFQRSSRTQVGLKAFQALGYLDSSTPYPLATETLASHFLDPNW